MTVLGKIRFFVFLSALMLYLSGCATDTSAPVVDRAYPGKPKVKSSSAAAAAAKLRDWRPDSHTVQKGDTLYSIALQYGLDYRELANLNALADTNLIHVGQVLRLGATPQAGSIAPTTSDTKVETIPLKTEPVLPTEATSAAMLITQPKAVKLPYSPAALAQLEQGAAPPAPGKVESATTSAAIPAPVKPAPTATATETDDIGLDWIWPTQGRLIAGFGEAKNSKGLDIAGKAGQAIYAAESGKVVYSGAGLRGYGRLVIIKHNPIYLSAYAHNRLVLVKEGQKVARGQKIAEMGDSDADQVKLHFEIRQMGKPVDPMKYLHGAQK